MDTKVRRGGRRNEAAARNGKRVGRPPKSIEQRALFAGKVAIRISPENALLAQRLMLHFPEQPNVESLYEYALRRLAETTDD